MLFFFTFCWRQVDIGLGEAPSKDIVCVLDEDKGSRVDALDEFQQVSQLANLYDDKKDFLVFSRIAAGPFENGNASVHFTDDQLADRIRLLGDDEHTFFVVKAHHGDVCGLKAEEEQDEAVEDRFKADKVEGASNDNGIEDKVGCTDSNVVEFLGNEP